MRLTVITGTLILATLFINCEPISSRFVVDLLDRSELEVRKLSADVVKSRQFQFRGEDNYDEEEDDNEEEEDELQESLNKVNTVNNFKKQEGNGFSSGEEDDNENGDEEDEDYESGSAHTFIQNKLFEKDHDYAEDESAEEEVEVENEDGIRQTVVRIKMFQKDNEHKEDSDDEEEHDYGDIQNFQTNEHEENENSKEEEEENDDMVGVQSVENKIHIKANKNIEHEGGQIFMKNNFFPNGMEDDEEQTENVNMDEQTFMENKMFLTAVYKIL